MTTRPYRQDRTIRLFVRLTAEEREMAEELAKLWKTTMSDAVRQCLVNAYGRETEDAAQVLKAGTE